MIWIGITIGLFLGTFLSFSLASLLVINKQAENYVEECVKKSEDDKNE